MKTSGRRTWAYRVLAVACGMGVAAIACEGILRLLPGLLPSGLYQRLQADPRNYGVAHPYIGHLHTPNSSFVIARLRRMRQSQLLFWHQHGVSFRHIRFGSMGRSHAASGKSVERFAR